MLGTAVFYGMLGVTIFGLFLTPASTCCFAGWPSGFDGRVKNRRLPPTRQTE